MAGRPHCEEGGRLLDGACCGCFVLMPMGGLLIRFDEIICSCAVRCCGILQANKMLS